MMIFLSAAFGAQPHLHWFSKKNTNTNKNKTLDENINKAINNRETGDIGQSRNALRGN